MAGALDAGLPLPLIEPDLQISRIRLSCEQFSRAKQAEVLQILVVAHAFGANGFLTVPRASQPSCNGTRFLAMFPLTDSGLPVSSAEWAGQERKTQVDTPFQGSLRLL